MLAQAPTAPPRRLPFEEITLTLGLWLLSTGIAAKINPVAYAGATLIVVALGRFAVLIVRVGRTRRIAPEGPLLHLLADALFWWSLALSLVIAFLLTVPVNRWLIARDRGHAVMHELHAH